MIKVGETYRTNKGTTYECIHVSENRAWMIFHSDCAAYVWNAETGESLSLGSEYDIQVKPREWWIDPDLDDIYEVYEPGYIHVREVIEND
jgi:hypothetical protein